MRSFAFLLLLAVIFLLGLLIGIDRDKPINDINQDTANLSELMVNKDTSSESESVEEVVILEVMPDSSEHLIQKTASFLESSVTGFYDMIVEVLYQISSLAF